MKVKLIITAAIKKQVIDTYFPLFYMRNALLFLAINYACVQNFDERIEFWTRFTNSVSLTLFHCTLSRNFLIIYWKLPCSENAK